MMTYMIPRTSSPMRASVRKTGLSVPCVALALTLLARRRAAEAPNGMLHKSGEVNSGEGLALVKAAEGDFLQQQPDRRGYRDGDQRADDAEQHAAHQDRGHADDGRDPDGLADDPGHDEVILGQPVADVEG